jgi:ParB-like chromosome segregation protein Spo0J
MTHRKRIERWEKELGDSDEWMSNGTSRVALVARSDDALQQLRRIAELQIGQPGAVLAQIAASIVEFGFIDPTLMVGNAVSVADQKRGIVMPTEISTEIQLWPIDKLVFYARNPRRNDAAVDRMCGSIREFGFKIPCLVRSDGEVIDGHLRLKAARKLGITDIPVIRCDEWTPAQVKAFRLLVNRSATWADWDPDLLALELQELNAADFDLSLTGFDPRELEDLLAATDHDEQADAAPPLPERYWPPGPLNEVNI